MISIFEMVSKWLNDENLNLLSNNIIKENSGSELIKYYLETKNGFSPSFSKITQYKIEREKSKVNSHF